MSVRLIVNADDFGYFAGVSDGILDAVQAGTVTATGVMANGPAFESKVQALRDNPQVDVGVHLNVTLGAPLTPGFPPRVLGPDGVLPEKGRLALALLRRRLPVAAVAAEWRAQIEKCRARGLTVRFLNSHEHVHMFPMLHPVIMALAGEFQVPFVRYTRPEIDSAYDTAAGVRALTIAGFNCFSRARPGTPRFLGLAPSGRLNLAYLERRFARLRASGVYELMCHPGRADPQAAAQPLLQAYHDWTGELDCLLSGALPELLARHAVRLTRFRDLTS